MSNKVTTITLLALSALLAACSDSDGVRGTAVQTNIVSVSATSADDGDSAEVELINVEPYTITINP